MKNTGKGWVTAEYGLLPRSTKERNQRESLKGKVNGRTQEIMRLIGRALRSVVDLNGIGERTVVLDCDVIQADGGTRTASITGAFVAMVDAFAHLQQVGIIKGRVLKSYLGAVSVGLIENEEILDLNYEEDKRAQVDMNIIMTSRGELVEIQGTAEGSPFSKKQMYRMVDVGHKGIKELVALQKEVLSDVKGLIWPDDVTPPPG
jgi:ribonuclease PH